MESPGATILAPLAKAHLLLTYTGSLHMLQCLDLATWRHDDTPSNGNQENMTN